MYMYFVTLVSHPTKRGLKEQVFLERVLNDVSFKPTTEYATYSIGQKMEI